MQPPYGESGKRIASISRLPRIPLKGRNLSSNPRLVVHVQDDIKTMILEGTPRREKRVERLNQLRKDYVRKYQYTPDWLKETEQIVFRVEPRVVHAWKAPRMHRSLVKFVF